MSLKATTRDRRGAGVRQIDIPERENKLELFRFLTRNLITLLKQFQIVTNVDYKIVTLPGSTSELQGLDISQMEEADGRILLHVKDMVVNGIESVLIRCSDTDVVVVGVSHFHELQDHGLKKLWILFGNALKKRYIPVHEIANKLGREKAVALRGFHGFTGCDSTSFFTSKGKRSAWSTWKDPDITSAFKCLSYPSSIDQLTDAHIKALEKFTIDMYDSRSEITAKGRGGKMVPLSQFGRSYTGYGHQSKSWIGVVVGLAEKKIILGNTHQTNGRPSLKQKNPSGGTGDVMVLDFMLHCHPPVVALAKEKILTVPAVPTAANSW
ncbi:uncharacterized protein LOC126744179 [Anthonomus grandis grandis]|uniref:uncharacterized protein LOC126744179 n=1 Tax=Anthonomus grandis grandis TaxID=2921223 RepID=UPI00216559FD|nr:uncharacterized protein LOC126744179 [Anthonomus grandis grandis]